MSDDDILQILKDSGLKDADKCIDVCNAISEGHSLRKACKQVGISKPTFLSRCNDNKDLADHYARARNDLLEYWANQVIDLTDQEFEKDQYGRIDPALIQQARLQVDSRRWILGKLQPRKYGDKSSIDLDVTGNVNVVQLSDLRKKDK